MGRPSQRGELYSAGRAVARRSAPGFVNFSSLLLLGTRHVLASPSSARRSCAVVGTGARGTAEVAPNPPPLLRRLAGHRVRLVRPGVHATPRASLRPPLLGRATANLLGMDRLVGELPLSAPAPAALAAARHARALRRRPGPREGAGDPGRPVHHGNDRPRGPPRQAARPPHRPGPHRPGGPADPGGGGGPVRPGPGEVVPRPPAGGGRRVRAGGRRP